VLHFFNAKKGRTRTPFLGGALIGPEEGHRVGGELIAGLEYEELGESARQEGFAHTVMTYQDHALVLSQHTHLRRYIVQKCTLCIIRQINTCRKVPLQVNFLDDYILLWGLHSYTLVQIGDVL
jgi:hypothetical protein